MPITITLRNNKSPSKTLFNSNLLYRVKFHRKHPLAEELKVVCKLISCIRHLSKAYSEDANHEERPCMLVC